MKLFVLRYSTFNFIVSLFIFFFAFSGVRYSSDWDGYTHFYTHSAESPDIAFGILADLFNNYNLEYYCLYQFHILIISVVFFVFISKFVNRYLLTTLVLLVFNYVVFGNQIRYFVAFPFALLSIYYLFVCSNKRVHVLLAILAILNHNAIILFFFCFYLILFLNKFYSKYFLSSIIVVNIVSLIFFKIIESLISGHFGAYFDSGQKSSLLGGIYSMLQCIIILFFIYRLRKSLNKIVSPILKDKFFIFLYLSSFSTSFIILPSLTAQIISNRYISPLIVVWIIIFLYVKGHEKSNYIKRLCNTYIILIILVKIAWVYLLPTILFGENVYVLESLVMLNSYEI